MSEPRTVNGAALIYCRVSTKALAKGTSLVSQRTLCIAQAERLGYSVSRVTREVYSGAELFERPRLSRDRADIRAGKYKALVAYSVDRLTRDEAHLAILKGECDRAGCRLIFVADSAESELPREAYAAGAERRNIVERMHRGHHSKLLQGRPVFNGTSLYGYRPDHQAGVYRVYEPEAEVVRRVFAMCAAGNGMHRIASTFNREGLSSPKSHLRQGARWSSGAVSLLLSNRSYMGEEICWKTKKSDVGRDLPRPESERVRLPEGVRPAIVSRELWEECRRKIESRAAKLKNTGQYPALLRGHIYCAECGAGMVRNHFRRGKYAYLKYRCGSRWRAFDTGCRGEAVPLEAAEEWAWGVARSILLSAAGSRSANEGVPVTPSADLEATRRAHARAASEFEALRAAAAGGEPLRQYVEQADGVMRCLEGILAELERRDGEDGRCAAGLLSLCDLVKAGGADLTFDGRRLALSALDFKAYANGADPTRWRYQTSIQ